jgi:hypothetical protein
LDHDRPPLNETAERYSRCMADAWPGGPTCGGTATLLLVLTCGARHCRLVAACNVHAAIAKGLTEPGALSPCALCEDLTGTAEPMILASVERWDPEHPAITDAERTRRELEAL